MDVRITQIRPTGQLEGIICYFDVELECLLERIGIKNFTFSRSPNDQFSVVKPVHWVGDKRYALVELSDKVMSQVKNVFARKCRQLGFDKKWQRPKEGKDA